MIVFGPLLLPPDVAALTVADLDGDGDWELVTVEGLRRLAVFDAAGRRIWGTRLDEPVRAAISVDLDRDGRHELLMAGERTGSAIRLAMGPDGYGLDVLPGAYPRSNLCEADTDGDGRWEIVIGETGFPARLFRYELGPDGFEAMPELQTTGGELFFACADIDGDGTTDIQAADTHFWSGVLRHHVFYGDGQEEHGPRAPGRPVAGDDDGIWVVADGRTWVGDVPRRGNCRPAHGDVLCYDKGRPILYSDEGFSWFDEGEHARVVPAGLLLQGNGRIRVWARNSRPRSDH